MYTHQFCYSQPKRKLHRADINTKVVIKLEHVSHWSAIYCLHCNHSVLVLNQPYFMLFSWQKLFIPKERLMSALWYFSIPDTKLNLPIKIYSTYDNHFYVNNPLKSSFAKIKPDKSEINDRSKISSTHSSAAFFLLIYFLFSSA